VVPHELVHLVFDTAVKNPYHFPPRWLNEGLAVYLSEGNGTEYEARSRAPSMTTRSSRSTGSRASSRARSSGSSSPTPRACQRSTTSSGPTAGTRSCN
jgi:hypothetical protein